MIIDFREKQDMLPRGTRLLCAVSGGADSMCLLHLMKSRAAELEIQVFAAHYEHGLRGEESLGDCAFVENWCREKGILCVSAHGDVRAFDTALQWHDEGRYHWDFVQIELNYLDWNYANEINPRNTDAVYLYNELQKRGIPAVIMEPLLGGRLAKVPDFIVKKMKQREPERSVASWAFRFAGTPEGVLTVLSGMTYMEHLKDNLITYSPLKPVSEEEHQFLMDIADDIYNLNTIPCNECNYCMPCPYGINIPAIFSHYNKCIQEGNMPNRGKQDPNYYKERQAFLVGYDRSVPRLRQASHCIGCRECVSHCPQRIQIPDEMHRIDRFVEELKQTD